MEDSHKALNALIQGSAADIMREAVVSVHHYLKRNDYQSHIVNIIHDEIMLDVVEDEVDDMCYNVPLLMKPVKINDVMPIEVDCEHSKTNWAEKEAYDWLLTTQ